MGSVPIASLVHVAFSLVLTVVCLLLCEGASLKLLRAAKDWELRLQTNRAVCEQLEARLDLARFEI